MRLSVRMSEPQRLLWPLSVGLILVFLLSPIAVLVFAAFDDGKFFRFPPRLLSLRWFAAALTSAEYLSAMWRSVIIATAAAFGSLILGTMAALALVRGQLRNRAWIEAVLLAPLTLPLVVWAVALLQIYSRLGISGTFPGLIAAHVIITLPFSVRLMIATFDKIDPELERAAQSLGAPPFYTFRKVTLPLARGGLIASTALSFVVSFNDVIVTTFIAGAGWTTFPVRMYAQLRGQGVDPVALAFGAMIVAVIVVVVLVAETAKSLRRTAILPVLNNASLKNGHLS